MLHSLLHNRAFWFGLVLSPQTSGPVALAPPWQRHQKEGSKLHRRRLLCPTWQSVDGRRSLGI